MSSSRMRFDREDGKLRHIVNLGPLLLVFLGSCISNPIEEFGPVPLLTQGVYVLNEGNPGRGNSSLTLYIPDSNKVYPDIFSAVNVRSLGDAGSDMVISGSQAFILMRGTNKIEVIRTTDNRAIQGIALRPGGSPYCMAIVGSKGYVTNLSSSFVTVIDINTFNILRDSINVGANSQGIAAIGGKVYVCNSGFGDGRTVTVIESAIDRVLRTVQVGDGPSFAKITSDGRVWVVCSGSYTKETPGKIFVIEPATDAIIDSISIPTKEHLGKISVSADGFAYVVGKNNVLKFNTRINQLLTAGFVVGGLGSNLYSVAVDDYNGDIYVADAKDSFQNGEVKIYGSDGVLKGRFDTGILPGAIVFKR